MLDTRQKLGNQCSADVPEIADNTFGHAHSGSVTQNRKLLVVFDVRYLHKLIPLDFKWAKKS